MSKRGNKEFFKDIIEAIERIQRYTRNMSFEEFLKDIKTGDAVIRNLEIIGEAVKNLTGDIKNQHKEIKWKDIAGMRDRIIHYYFGVNWDIVWVTIKEKLPELKKKIESILKEKD